MASILYSPFNYDSGTFAIKTASYTVPAGKYAYCQALHADCTINGNFLEQSFTSGNVIDGVGAAGFLVLSELEWECYSLYVSITKLNTSGGGQSFRLGYTVTDKYASPTNAWVAGAVATNYISYYLTNSFTTVGGTLTGLVEHKTYLQNCYIGAFGQTSGGTIDAARARRFAIVQRPVGGAGLDYNFTFVKLTRPHNYWLKAGNVITGTRWNITEYNSIT